MLVAARPRKIMRLPDFSRIRERGPEGPAARAAALAGQLYLGGGPAWVELAGYPRVMEVAEQAEPGRSVGSLMLPFGCSGIADA